MPSLQHSHLDPVLLQEPRGSQPDHARADDPDPLQASRLRLDLRHRLPSTPHFGAHPFALDS